MNDVSVRVLVVEDEEAHIELMRWAFVRQGGRFRLTWAKTVEQARASIAESQPDLVIADLLLPDGRGMDLLLSADNEPSRFPVVMIASHGDEQLAVEAIKAGALDYVAKSVAALADIPHVADRALREWQHIAKRKQAEAAVVEEHNLLRTLITHMPDSIFIKDAQSRFLVANQAVAQFMGTTPDMLIGKTDFDFYPEDLARQYYADEQALLNSGQPQIDKEEPYYIDQASNPRWFSTTKMPFHDSQGRVKGIVGISREVTERKQVEQVLQKARDELEARVEHRTAELKQVNAQLAALYQVGQTITAPLQLDVVLDLIARSTAQLLNTDTGAILLVDEKRETLTIKGAYGLSERVVKGTRDRLGESIAGRVVQTGEPIIANDLPNDPRFYNPSASEEGLLACASVPLMVGDRIIGTLDVHSKTTRQAFSEAHIQMLNMLASQAAIAIENARLYEELRRAHDELEERVRQRTAELIAANEHLRQEISERQRAETAWRESQERYRALYEDNPSMYFTVDAVGTVLSVNRFGAEQLGYAAAELVGQSVLKVFYDEDQDAVQRQLALCLQNLGQIAHWEFRKVRKDGSLLWVKEEARAVRDADGRPIVLIVCEDITDRKRVHLAH
jgi:PAS domain S-box-containing protein